MSPGLPTTERGAALQQALLDAAVTLLKLPERELSKLSTTEQPQGVVAVVRPPDWTLDDLVLHHGPVLVLDGVQDPGNVGAVVRTVWALGGAGVVALPGTAELYSPKTLRGSMGALFTCPAVRCETAELAGWLSRNEVTLWVARAGATPVAGLAAPERLALALGNEGAGVGDALARLARATVSVPQARAVESLNVAVAAGILIYEVTRER